VYVYTVKDIASDFGTSHQNVYNWIKAGAVIKGKKGERQIVITKVVAKEKQ